MKKEKRKKNNKKTKKNNDILKIYKGRLTNKKNERKKISNAAM